MLLRSFSTLSTCIETCHIISVLPSVICGYNQHYVTKYVFQFHSSVLYSAFCSELSTVVVQQICLFCFLPTEWLRIARSVWSRDDRGSACIILLFVWTDFNKGIYLHGLDFDSVRSVLHKYAWSHSSAHSKRDKIIHLHFFDANYDKQRSPDP